MKKTPYPVVEEDHFFELILINPTPSSSVVLNYRKRHRPALKIDVFQEREQAEREMEFIRFPGSIEYITMLNFGFSL